MEADAGLRAHGIIQLGDDHIIHIVTQKRQGRDSEVIAFGDQNSALSSFAVLPNALDAHSSLDQQRHTCGVRTE